MDNEEFNLPTGDVRPKFPWQSAFWPTFGIAMVSILVQIVAAVVISLVFLAPMLLPGVKSLVAAHKEVFDALMQTVVYCGSFGLVIYLFSRLFPGISIIKLIGAHPGNLKNGKVAKYVGIAVVGYIGAILLVSFAYKYLPLPPPYSPAGDYASNLQTPLAMVLFALQACVLAPLFEEVFFRGFLLNVFRAGIANSAASKIGMVACNVLAILLSSAIFAGAHGTLSGFVGLFIIGCVLAEVYRSTGSLYTSMIMHMMVNLGATIALFFLGAH